MAENSVMLLNGVTTGGLLRRLRRELCRCCKHVDMSIKQAYLDTFLGYVHDVDMRA